MRGLVLLITTMTALACGRGGGGSSPDAAPVMTVTVEDSGALPACGGGNKNQLIYVTAEKQFQTCDGSVWQAVELPETKIAVSVFCTGQLDTTGIYVSYSAASLTTGDVFVSADVADGVIQASGTNFYSRNQNGASAPGVLITYDMAAPSNGGYWDVNLNLDTFESVVVYKDVDTAGGSQTWTMPASKCIVNDYR